MIRAYYSGKTGLSAQQTAMDTIANNISNVNTTGYKEKNTGFSDVLSSSMVRPDDPAYATMLTGNGVAVSRNTADMSDGLVEQTGDPYDYRATGGGFFAVTDAGGNLFFTKDGSFGVLQGQDGPYLGTPAGQLVLGANGAPIPIDADGNPQAEPGVISFANPGGLLNLGGNLYTVSGLSGAPALSGESAVRGQLEGSNVDLAGQMARMIETQRAFQMSSRVVQAADQIEDMTNSLKT